ncbi:helix-turn-helix domain-containing protein [Terribacillus saccharophilus]|uniref:helix-turn-helix domain-containing protein n=2 Tax=Terribacillus saccharophilus TaxID=361277 RepID=UPI001475B951|nr:helix-turn-helix domain-containing protein [Terribacillus goriensis]
MEIGPLIKLHRIKQNMTQEDLAAGIVSESYLSKIENQKTDASPEVIALLCERLGIQLNAENEDMIKEKAEEWFALLYDAHSREERDAKYQELEQLFKNSNSDYEILFEIHKIRYYLLRNENEKTKEQIEKLTNLEYSFDTRQSFFWNKYLGNYYQNYEDDNVKALQFYKMAEALIKKIELAETDIADIHYTLAVTHTRLINDLKSIEYANKALDVFRQNYNFVRCAQCHILLGICYRRVHMIDMAIKQYNLAQHLGEITENSEVIQLSNHNLGYLHSTLGESDEAIKYLEKAYEMGSNFTTTQITTTISLIKEYYNSERIDEAKMVLEKNYPLVKELPAHSKKLFKLEMDVYKYAIYQDYNKLEHTIINEFLPYLEEKSDYANIVTYSNMIGEHFEKLKKYKNAANYYKMASLNYQKLLKV